MSEDLLDVLDQYGNSCGKATRQECHLKGLWHRIIAIFIFNSKNELLLQVRTPKRSTKRFIDHSVGGHVDGGESPNDTASREMREEMGIEKPWALIGETVENCDTDFGKMRHLCTVYALKHDESIVPNPHEVKEHFWMSLKEVEDRIKTHPDDFFEIFRDNFALFMGWKHGQE